MTATSRRPGRPARADLTTADVAERLGISTDAVDRLVADRQITYVNVGSTKRPRRRFTEDDVADLIERRTQKAAS